VFPARYELNSYIVFRKRLVSKRLKTIVTKGFTVWGTRDRDIKDVTAFFRF
jgi:hypothetical protein